VHFGTLLDYRMHADLRYIPVEQYSSENVVVCEAADLRYRRMEYWSWERHHILLVCQTREDETLVHFTVKLCAFYPVKHNM
jgi:hypothetical protein